MNISFSTVEKNRLDNVHKNRMNYINTQIEI